MQPIKKFIKNANPKHMQLLVDAILVIASLTIPHASLPISIFAIIKILRDFHLSNKEDEEED